MHRSLPDHAAYMRQTYEQLSAIEPETDLIESAAEELRAQLCVRTATTALSRYERDFGLPEGGSLTYAQRRDRICAMIMSHGTCTIYKLRDTIYAITGCRAEIEEDPPNYMITIKYVDTLGVPKHQQDVEAAVKRMLPAHLGYRFTYKYNTLGHFRDWTVGEVGGYTFGLLAVMDTDAQG